METQKLLVETLNQLSPEEFVVFKSLIEDANVSLLLPRNKLKTANTQDVVKLMLKAHGHQSVEVTRDVLEKMKKMELVQRLSAFKSDSASASYSGNERPLPLTKRVEALESVTWLLLETLDHLGDEEKEDFKEALSETHWRWSNYNSFHILQELTDLQDKVLFMVHMYGSSSVEKITEVLKKMNKTELVQRLTDGSSVTKETHLDEHLSALVHKVVTVRSVEKVLFETLTDLSTEDLKKVKWLLQVACYQRNLPQWSWKWLLMVDPRKMANMIVRKYGQQSVEFAVEVFTDINRTDLVQRLSGSSSGTKERPVADEHWPALIQKVETLSSDTELLLETLADLSDEELKDFREFVQTQFNILGSSRLDLQEIVILMVQDHGQRSVKNFVEILKQMNKHELVKRLSDRRSASKQKPSDDEWRSAFIRKVSTVAAVKHLLLEIVSDLRKEEFQQFKKILQMFISRKGLSRFFLRLDKCSTVVEVVDVMVQALGRQSVEMTRQALLYMNRTDLVQRFPETSSELECNIRKIIRSLSTEFSGGQIKDQAEGTKLRFEGPALLEEEAETKRILSANLADIKRNELLKFVWFLQFTCFQKSLPQIPKYTSKLAYTLPELVDLMLEKLGERSVEVIREVFQDMKKILLTEPSASAGGASSSSEPEGPASVTEKSSIWTKVKPEVNDSAAGEATTYRLQSAAGHFECSVSGLRWVCKEEVGLKYQFCSWERHMERMKSRQYSPAGPLMDVMLIAGKINEVLLPHWVCIDDIPNLLENFKVLHINDSGEVLETASEVTPSHVRLTDPDFSLLAALVSSIFRVKVSCDMLIYYQPHTTFLKLRLYLIPHDSGVKEAVNKSESSRGFEEIKMHRPNKFLKMHQGFSLNATVDTVKVQPKEITLRYDSQDPNCYGVLMKNPDRQFSLELRKSSSPKDDPVWICEFWEGDYPKSGPSKEATSVRTAAHAKEAGAAGPGGPAEASSTTGSANMEQKKMLKESLMNISAENFNAFLDALWGRKEKPRIFRVKVEGKSPLEVADVMITTFGEQRALEVAEEILRYINCNQDADELAKKAGAAGAAGAAGGVRPAGTSRTSRTRRTSRTSRTSRCTQT
ncbi:uncharacterized protein LOC133440385 isoform X2 [Cololabis saira]|uniref:uncharacterized protein LOC133440385 isoform X2 n=1 Tax=Cololabis saira TaxID=129043 RepID=UPI002AD58497|nr:uncharacterized protein LOC133440385 isoform X2 [Cololabis saira]